MIWRLAPAAIPTSHACKGARTRPGAMRRSAPAAAAPGGRSRRGRAVAAALLVAAWSVPGAAALPELDANLQYDVARLYSAPGADVHADANAPEHGWRRRRLGATWEPAPDVELRAEYDFAAHAWTDAYVRVQAAGTQWSVGQFKQPFSLATLGSDRSMLLMEAEFARTFGIDRRIGIGAHRAVGRWTYQGSAFGQALDGSSPGIGAATRAVVVPLQDARRVLHLGAGLAWEQPDAPRAISLRPQSALVALRLAQTGAVDARSMRRWGIEAGWRDGPLLLQGELARLESGSGEHVRASGGYLELGWMLTGETRSYADTLFGGPTPDRRLGALEATARIERIELQGGSAGNGQGQDSLSVGLNWYLGKRSRLMANHVWARQRGAGSELLSPRVLQARVQVGF